MMLLRIGVIRRASASSFYSPHMWMPAKLRHKGAKWSASSIAILLTISGFAGKVMAPCMTPKASPTTNTSPSALNHTLGDSRKESIGFKNALMCGVTNHHVQQALMLRGPLDTQVRKRRYVIIILGRTCPARGPPSHKEASHTRTTPSRNRSSR